MTSTVRCVPQGWASDFAPGEREQMNILICFFFSCLCTQISPQKTVVVQSPENKECLFPCFLVFIQETLMSVFSHHWALACWFVSPNYEMGCTKLSQKKTFAPV